MKAARAFQGASPRSCDRCGAPVLRQEVGQRAALKVVADVESIPLQEALRMVEPDRLAWCVATLYGGGVDLRWLCPGTCGHGTVIEHRCPEGAPQIPGALW